MKTSKFNWILLGTYILSSLIIFIASIISPIFRDIAKAPLRDWILPPPEPIVIHMLYSTEKDAWLKEVITGFDRQKLKVNGHPITIKMEQMGSREMVLAILDGKEKPVLVSPASMLQATMLADQSEAKFGKSLIPLADPKTCIPVVKSPLVLVAWKERADALWGPIPPEEVWNVLHDALLDPKGWETYGHPDWGYIKFGHTNPETSNSGLMTLLSMTYDYFGKSTGLASSDLLKNADFQKWLMGMENTISKFGDSTGTYMNDIVAYGPSVYDFVSVYEANAIEQAQNAKGRYGELHVYYPRITIMSDHPFCLVSADWVTPDQKEAASIFRDYLLSPETQQIALLNHGFRPVEPSIGLTQPGSPFAALSGIGVKPTLPPEAIIPQADFLNTLLDFWHRNVYLK
jgi:ABC-type Fe3+ transport system substrate-binding protein